LENYLVENLSPRELEVAQLIVETLNLEDIGAEEIERDAPLFRDGLGLDSIDALELSLGIKQRYGIQLRADDENIAAIFATLASLAQYIEENR
jgi:acyl carrier protein